MTEVRLISPTLLLRVQPDEKPRMETTDRPAGVLMTTVVGRNSGRRVIVPRETTPRPISTDSVVTPETTNGRPQRGTTTVRPTRGWDRVRHPEIGTGAREVLGVATVADYPRTGRSGPRRALIRSPQNRRTEGRRTGTATLFQHWSYPKRAHRVSKKTGTPKGQQPTLSRGVPVLP